MENGRGNWLQGLDLNQRSRGYEPRGMSSSLPCETLSGRGSWRIYAPGRQARRHEAKDGVHVRVNEGASFGGPHLEFRIRGQMLGPVLTKPIQTLLMKVIQCDAPIGHHPDADSQRGVRAVLTSLVPSI